MLFHRILWVIDLAAVATIFLLLFPELSREPFHRDDLQIFVPVAAVLAIVFGGAYALGRRNRLVLANLLLIVFAIPAWLLAALFIALSLHPIAFR